MCQPRKWLWGLLPLLLLGILGVYWQQVDLEKDLTQRGVSALAQAASGWGKVSIAGRDAVIQGEAPSPEAKAAALKAVEGVEGVRRVSDAATVLAEVKPFTFTAMRDAAKVTLSGYVPNAAARDALLEAARKAVPGAQVTDETKMARGAPAEFGALASFGLSQLGKLSPGTLQLSDSILSLTGRAASFEAFSAARAALGALPAGTKLAKGLGAGDILPPLVKPFTFEAVREGSTLTFNGYVPTPEARLKLLAQAKALGLSVRDNLKVADGAPAGDWAGSVGLGLAALGKLESGKFSGLDEKFSLSGKAPLGVTQDALKAGLGLPTGFSLAALAIEEAAKPAPAPVAVPFSFTAEHAKDLVSLKGLVPDEKAKADAGALAARLFQGAQIDNQLSVAVVPREAMSLAAGGLQLLSRLGPGSSLSIEGTSVTLKGLALYDAARDSVIEEFKRLVPAGFTGTAEVGTAQAAPTSGAAQCQSLFNEVLAAGSIHFRVASASLSDESRGILDKLTAVALRCGEVQLEIGGHTDADGSPETNAQLSRLRAEAVALYLTRGGIPVQRLAPVGYGETRPLVANDSPENKAKNRRIEFIVK